VGDLDLCAECVCEGPLIIIFRCIRHGPISAMFHFSRLVGRFTLNVSYKPISLPKVFAETGGLPVTKRHPARLRYRMIEQQRWRENRRLNFKLRPKFFPFEAELADRFVIAVAAAGYDPDSFLRRAFAALWEDEQISLTIRR